MTITMGKKYQTRDGRAVRILCVDGPLPDYPIIGFIEGLYCPIQWNKDGRISSLERLYNNDLIPVPEREPVVHQMWAVVYADGDYRSAVKDRFLFSTEVFAQGAADSENREHPSLTHGKAHVALVTWNREDISDTSTVPTKHGGWGLFNRDREMCPTEGDAREAFGKLTNKDQQFVVAHITWEG